MSAILNLAAYKFVALDRLPERRKRLLEQCRALEFRGTILLSPEGINLFLAGPTASLRRWFDQLREDPLLADLEGKESFSETPPFNRMLVKIKQEIIPCGIETIVPEAETSPKLSATHLKQWLDDGRDLILLDVRNDFEVEVGTFDAARPVGIESFRDFDAAVERMPTDWKQRPVVMFCTGGIRCEKAGPLMQQKGFQQVFQLDGGILKYFEQVGGDHFHGHCFVFDDRVAVDAQLAETGLHLCYACHEILEPEEIRGDHYRKGEYCPRCYQEPQQVMRDSIGRRQQQLAELAKWLPGCHPHEQCRPIRIPQRHDGGRLDEVLAELFAHVSDQQWEAAFAEGRITEGTLPVRPARRVRSGEQFLHRTPGFVEPEVSAAIEILWEDEAIVVVNKPAPLPVHPSGRFKYNTLLGLMNEVYQPGVLRAAHRLDANTTGVMVLGRSRQIARRLQSQFEQQAVGKVYRARCWGHPPQDDFVCQDPITTQSGPGRVRLPDVDGLSARTEVKVLARNGDGTSDLRIRPTTGRTNQIRAHLWHRGFPVVGDPLYERGGQLGENQVLAIDQPAMMLHAESLCLRHPVTDELMTFEAVAPEWCGCLTQADFD